MPRVDDLVDEFNESTTCIMPPKYDDFFLPETFFALRRLVLAVLRTCGRVNPPFCCLVDGGCTGSAHQVLRGLERESSEPVSSILNADWLEFHSSIIVTAALRCPQCTTDYLPHHAGRQVGVL